MKSSWIFVLHLLLAIRLSLGFAKDLPDNHTSSSSGEVSSSDGRIVGGEKIPLSLAPYQVSLQYRSYHICGGSIISTTYILSAAHCVFMTSQTLLTVRAGTDRLREGGEVVRVKSVKMHPLYNTTTYSFDFALLQLQSAIKLVPGVKEIIALPASNEVIPDGTSALVTGWGDTKNVAQSNYFLRGVIVKTINRNICKHAYATISDQMICAGDWAGGIDSCQGDSGGPLKRIEDGKLIGVVSFGQGCALPRFPGVYSKVAAVRNWIQSNVRKS